MEITLEKIELVKDRTGVTYKEAKEALEAANGSVVDAIISIEETIDVKAKAKMGSQGTLLVDKIKEVIKRGNVARIIVKKEDMVILNLPLNAGLIGAVLAPWAVVAGVITVFGTKCTLEFLKDNGEIIEVTEIAADAFADVKEKGSVVMEEMKTRGSEVFENVKAKAADAMNKAKQETEEGACQCGEDCDCDPADCNCEEGQEKK